MSKEELTWIDCQQAVEDLASKLGEEGDVAPITLEGNLCYADIRMNPPGHTKVMGGSGQGVYIPMGKYITVEYQKGNLIISGERGAGLNLPVSKKELRNPKLELGSYRFFLVLEEEGPFKGALLHIAAEKPFI